MTEESWILVSILYRTLFTVSRPTPLFPRKVGISVRVTTCLLKSLEKLSRGELRWLLHVMAIVQEIVTESRELLICASVGARVRDSPCYLARANERTHFTTYCASFLDLKESEGKKWAGSM